jgi:RecB family endonuclease NucS
MQIQNKISVLTEPSLAEAVNLIEKAFLQRKTLIVAGNCTVDYTGRANSKLEPGERLLIIKSDGSLLIHRPIGYEPVNWQPAGGVFHAQIKGNELEVHAIRHKPRESVRVKFSQILLVSTLRLIDAGDFFLNASEEDMHRAILIKPSLLEDGFKPISWEKHVEPGFVDIYGEDKEGRLVIVEVKRKAGSKQAALQLSKYVEPIKARVNREIRAILAAPSLGKDVQRILVTLGLEFKALDPKECAAVLKKVQTQKLESFL